MKTRLASLEGQIPIALRRPMIVACLGARRSIAEKRSFRAARNPALFVAEVRMVLLPVLPAEQVSLTCCLVLFNQLLL